MVAYYNEIEPSAAAWLRELIKQGLIADGIVDTRSITEVQPADLAGYTQCHFFAGIGVWSHALRNAGWPDNRIVWTGSCPCQPFSSASGKRKGKNDERHLWPHFFRLIRQCYPPVVFGEQVASADGLDWLDSVCFDLESANYATAAADLCAAGVGAPHVRQRLYWVADASLPQCQADGLPSRMDTQHPSAWHSGSSYELADADNARQQGDGLPALQRGRAGDGEVASLAGSDAVGGLADADQFGRKVEVLNNGGCDASVGKRQADVAGSASTFDRTSTPHGGWSAPDWILCRDAKWRPVESGTFPLVDGAAARVGRLRGYGNAIVPQVAEAFIRAFLKCQEESADR